MRFELTLPKPEHRPLFQEYWAAWARSGESTKPYSTKDVFSGNFDAWYSAELDRQNGDVPAGYVASTSFLLIGTDENGARILAAANFRHKLNDELLRYSGHIGYGTRPDERRKGYMKALLVRLLPVCHERGYERVLITCDRTNIASAKTIESVGGILENEVWRAEDMENEGRWIKRYWVKTFFAK